MRSTYRNRVLIKAWHDLCVFLGDRFTISESAVSHLFVNLLLCQGRVRPQDICPEDYYTDQSQEWRRIDLVLGKDLLFETGKLRAERARRLDAAVEFKVESQAVTITLAQIESDAAKLQELTGSHPEGWAIPNVLVLFRSKRNQESAIPIWRELSRRFLSVRFVVGFLNGEGVRVVHLHQGRVWDIRKGEGHFYNDWRFEG